MSYLYMNDFEDIFNEIYNQNIEKIYRFVYLKVSSQETAEDLTSEAFLRIWDVMSNGQKLDNPRAFLYQIARNLVVDFYRERGKVKIVSTETIQITDARPDLEEKAILSSDIEGIKQALANINEDYQDIIIWHYLDDLSVPEIAQITGKSEGATRVTLHRALKSLQGECNKTPIKTS